MNPQHDNNNHDQRSHSLDDELDELFTLPELANLLRVPPQTLRYWRNQHTGPASFKIGRHVRYRREDIDRWLREQRALADRARTINADGQNSSAAGGVDRGAPMHACR